MANWFDIVILPQNKRSIWNVIDFGLQIPRLLLFKGSILEVSNGSLKPSTTIDLPRVLWVFAPILLPLIGLLELFRLFIRPIAKWKHPKEYELSHREESSPLLETSDPILQQKPSEALKPVLSGTQPETLQTSMLTPPPPHPTPVSIPPSTEEANPSREDARFTIRNTKLTALLGQIAFCHDLTREQYQALKARKDAITLIQDAAANPTKYNGNLLTTPNNPDRSSDQGTIEKDRKAGFPRNTPLQLAVKAGDLEMVTLLLPHYSKEDLLHTSALGNNALHVAMVDHHWDAAELILRRAAELNALESLLQSANGMGWTPMQLLQILSITGVKKLTFVSEQPASTSHEMTTLILSESRRSIAFGANATLNRKGISGANSFYDALLGGEESTKDNGSFLMQENGLLNAAGRGANALQALLNNQESPSVLLSEFDKSKKPIGYTSLLDAEKFQCYRPSVTTAGKAVLRM